MNFDRLSSKGSAAAETTLRGATASVWCCWLFSRVNLVLLSLALFFWLECDFECRLYDAFVSDAVHAEMSPLDRVIAICERTHYLLDRRGGILTSTNSYPFRSPKRTWFHSGDLQLLEGNFSCGSYAAVFVEACHQAGIGAKVCQLRTGGQSIHVLAEVYVNDRWIAADPFFNQLFYGPDGLPVGLRDVVENWNYYREESPPSYRNLGQDPEGVVYTNWKRNRLLTLTKRFLDLTFGVQFADSLSLRSYFLNTYRVYFRFTLGVFVFYNIARCVFARTRTRNRKIAFACDKTAPSGK